MQGAEAAPRPFDENELDQYFRPFGDFDHVALGVSGGADSVALLRFAHDWAGRTGGHTRLSVLTVDHGLRPEAEHEAATVAAIAGGLGLPHETLRWTGLKPRSGVQAAARDARLELLCTWCRTHGAEALALAHTANDQAETVLMRLLRGSGVDGLSGMAELSYREGLPVLRPLLRVGRDRLETALRAMGQDWIEDPSNRDERFERIRIRRLLSQMKDEGDGIAGICRTASRMADVRGLLDRQTNAFVADAVAVSRYGYCEIDRKVFRRADAEIARRVLARALMAVSGQIYPPARDGLKALREGLCADQDLRRTFALCFIDADAGSVRVIRESGPRSAHAMAVSGGETVRWDNRFVLELPAGIGQASVGALERDGWSALRADAAELECLPARVRDALPCVRGDDGRLFLPHAGDPVLNGGVRVHYDDRGLLAGAADRDLRMA